MFDNKYPYTDFSQLNLDWFLLKFKELLEEQERVSGKVKDLDDTVKEFTDFVTNYFDNLDVQAEVNVKLNEMAADGTLSDLLAPLVAADIGDVVADQIGDTVAGQIDDAVADQIDAVVADQIDAAVAPEVPGAVTSWLNDNVDPVGSAVVVDSTLSIAGAAADAKTVGDLLSIVDDNIDNIDDIVYYQSDNKYDPSLQTPDTISPHYYVNGEPYSDPQYDSLYNCTAPISIKPNTTYTVGLVPVYGDMVKPWYAATQGWFLYDENDDYITGLGSNSSNTFTTPINARTLRFNYYIGSGASLDLLNERCMLVEGSVLPNTYEEYLNSNVKEKVDELNHVYAVNYIINSSTSVTLISKYSLTDDIAITLMCKGGNDLFDFYSIGLIPNTSRELSKTVDGIQYLISSSGDWHAPFVVGAVNNIDGDDPTSHYFTGGNHQYNNQGSGSTPTARGTLLKFFADNMEVTTGSGSCNHFEMQWINLVQGYNTRKADGTGREILQENHRMVFDGISFKSYVDLIPLEDVYMETWYGFQWFTGAYPYVRYIGAANRAEYVVADAASFSGDDDCCHAVGYSDDNAIRINIFKDYDLGDHKYYSGAGAMFTVEYGKGYAYIIRETNLYDDDMYSLAGEYKFEARYE